MIRFHLIASLVLVFAAGYINAQEQENDYDSVLSEIDLDYYLILSVDKGDSALAMRLIVAGANVDASTYDGVTPLMYAVQNNNLSIVKMLVQQGAHADIKPANGLTALLSAVRNGYYEIAEYLIREGADVNLPDNSKKTPLMYAIEADSFYMPDMLLYYDASIDKQDNKGVSALMLAAYLNRIEILNKLIELGANVNQVDFQNNTPLHYAAMAGNIEIMDLLVLNGAMLEMTNSSGYTPLSIAVRMNDYPAARLMIGYGANVNSRINNCLNPLALAIENKNELLAEMLQKNEAKINTRPCFNRFILGANWILNNNDNQLGLYLGLNDSKYNFMIGLGYGFRPKAIQIIKQVNDSTYYQYWEKRHYIKVSVDKAFMWPIGQSRLKTGLLVGFSEALTFGGYRGASANPETRLAINPRIGAILEYDFARVKLNYEFMDLHLEKINRSWFTITLEFLINRNKAKIKLPIHI